MLIATKTAKLGYYDSRPLYRMTTNVVVRKNEDE